MHSNHKWGVRQVCGVMMGWQPRCNGCVGSGWVAGGLEGCRTRLWQQAGLAGQFVCRVGGHKEGVGKCQGWAHSSGLHT